MNYDVFISYSRKDTKVADRICAALDNHGISYFIDRKGIGGGMEFPAVLAHAIMNSKIMLFLGSKNSYESKFTNSEVTFAFNKKPKGSIIPYIIDKSKLPDFLEFTFSSINIRTIEEHPIEPILVNDILQLIHKPNSSFEGENVFNHLHTSPDVKNEGEYEIQLIVCDNRKNVYGEKLCIPDNRDNRIRYGFKDKDGSVVVPCVWKHVNQFKSGLALVQNENDEWGWINKAGQIVIPCKWIDAFEFSEGLACVKDKNSKKWGFIDRTGELVIPYNWKGAGSFHESLAYVENDADKYGYINRYGELVIPCIWEGAFHFSEGLAGVRNDNWKWGFINKQGEIVILCKWEGVFDFQEGLCIVTNDHEKYGFIDKTGNVVIPIKYRNVRDFSNGKAYADGEYIDKTGQVVISRDEVISKESKISVAIDSKTIWEAAAKEVQEERKFDFSFMKHPKEERLKLLRENLDETPDKKKSTSNLSEENRRSMAEVLERIKF